MKTQRKILAIASLLLALGTASTARAQFDETNNLFYHAQRVPQSNQLNPAFFPNRNSFYLSLPGITTQFGSPLAIGDIICYDKATETSVVNIDSILHHLTEDNQLRFGLNIDILGLGLKIKNFYLNAGVRLVNQFSFGLPVSTINALLEGNVGEDGQIKPEVELLNGDLFNAQSYLETSLGFAYRFQPIHLTVGIRAKLLSGIVSAQTDHTRVVFVTDSNLNHVAARIYYELQAAAAVPYDTDKKGFDLGNKSVSDYMSGLFSNTGLAFDLGARWDLGPLMLSFAINDLSAGIHWSKNTYSVVPKHGTGEIEFNGVNINHLIDHGSFNIDSITGYLNDRLDGMQPRTVADSGDYWMAIPTKINVGASFTFLRYLRAGILFHGQFDRGLFTHSNPISAAGIADNFSNTFRWNTTVSFSANLFNWAEFIAGTSIVYDGKSMDLFNPGVGVILTPGTVFQTYIMADYVSSIRLVESKAFNVRLGINILLGKGGKTLPQFNPVDALLTPNE